MTMKQKVASELLVVARDLLAMDFPNQDSYSEYMDAHPDADPSNHKVVKKEKSPAKKEEPAKSEGQNPKIRADRVLLRRELSKRFKEDDLIPQEKDKGRISDITVKATSGYGKNKVMDMRKVTALTNSMASKITDPAKAYRRAMAFYTYVEMNRPKLHPALFSRLQKMDQIFLDRCAELLNGKTANQKVAHELLMIAKDLMSKEAWKNWSWLNGHSDTENHRFWQQKKKHDKESRLHPDEHKQLEHTNTLRGYEHYRCSCGFEYQVDSSG